MEARREYGVVLGALCVGAVLVLLPLQPTWVEVRLPPTSGSTLVDPLSATDLAPWLYGMGLVALAGAVGVVATRGALRRLVGLVLAVAGLVVVGSAAAVLADPVARAVPHLHGTIGSDLVGQPRLGSLSWWWPALVALGGLLVVAAGVAVVVHGGRWPVMAARYEAPASVRRDGAAELSADAPADPWRALDRGEDPTLAPGEGADGGHLPE